jgi:hypothetical protein
VTTRRFLALFALAVAACSSQPSLGSRFNGPTATVAFRGFTHKDAAIRDYLAVASSSGDELRLIDPADLQPVLSPGAVFPLSVPTAPRPLVLAAASLRDLDANGTPLDLADVLVAASAGGAPLDSSGVPVLQLIETWHATSRVAQSVPLTGLAPGSQILCLAGVPARFASGALIANARIVVGVSGGLLAIVEFTRATDGSGAVVPGTITVKALGFDPSDIAVSPDGTTLYIATTDRITTDSTLGAALDVFGVAQLGNATQDFASATATLKALAAGPKDPDAPATGNGRIGAGTVAVAVGSNVPERTASTADASSADRFTTFTSFVYAALDANSCGSGKPIDCGIVVIDPAPASTLTLEAGNLAPDPASADPAVLTPDSGPALPPPLASTLATAQKYRAPMPVPGTPLHIAIGVPPASGTERVTNDPLNPNIPLLHIAPTTGQRNAGAVAMVASSDGNVYWLDLSRWGPPSDISVTNGAQPPASSRVGVTSVAPAPVTGAYQLGLWQDLDNAPFGSTLPAPVVQVDALGIQAAIDVWPGFTGADTWTLAYQGALPSLSSRSGVLASDSAGTYAAIQTTTGIVRASIGDPSLGVRVGDVVQVVQVAGSCETTVAKVLSATDPASSAELDALAAATGVSFRGGSAAGDPSARGGAVLLAPPGSPGVTCTAAQILTAGPPLDVTLTVLASGMVLSNAKLGYLGRPGIGRTADRNDGAFSVAWTATADGSAASASEARAVARKARRLFYPSDPPCPISGSAAGTEGALASGCYGANLKRLADPLAPGPIIRFRVGLVGPTPSDPAAFPVRGDSIVFVTQAGLSQTFRRPVTGGVGPRGPIAFDRTALDPTGKAKPQFAGHENDPVFFFVPYLDNQVLAFSSTEAASQVTSIR